MLLKLGDELAKLGVEARPDRAGVRRKGQSIGQLPDLRYVGGMIAMALPHRRDGRVESGGRLADRGEEDQLLLLHMHFHLADQAAQDDGKALWHMLVTGMYRLDLLGHFGEGRQLLSAAGVIARLDMAGQRGGVDDARRDPA